MALPIPLSAARQLEHTLSGFDFVIDKNWRGEPVDHEPFHVHLEWFFQRLKGRPHKRVVKAFVEGPLFDDPAEPDDLGGVCHNLYDYECVELFFANGKNQYLEIEIGPHGHWLVLLFKERRVPLHLNDDLELEVQNVFEGNTWRSVFEIPLAYFPPKVSRFNGYALHGSGKNRHYEAVHPIFDGRPNDAPDFHRLEFFRPIKIEKIIPESFNDHSFNDLYYGDLWAETTVQPVPIVPI
ncbi:unnamed protein product [Soboliphyme baturini]|uniref:DUF2961 domain-containing protein n=1 Tax=Soboliphyme baturini TaxID=241478 RepID=A0A183IJG6_9BILA|nr:unnamed protein product [Soboliphyme baturini]